MILIIDDDSVVRSSLNFMLKRAGYEAQAVPSPREAMDVVRSVTPDLILMDGGKTQVHAAEEVLLAFGMDIPVCGMVKDDRHRTRGLLFHEQEIRIPLTSEGFKLVTRIQDEVHRFAITYHRKLRDERNLHSVLDDIKGIGEVRRKALLRHFGSIERIAAAEVADLLEVDGMTIPAAEQVYLFFHREELQNG